MLQQIPLTWKPIRNRSFAGMLGQHQLAYVLQHDGQTTWKWMVSGCNGTIRYDFQSADTLDEAKAAVQASVDQWFRQAGLLGQEHWRKWFSNIFCSCNDLLNGLPVCQGGTTTLILKADVKTPSDD